MRTKKAVPVEKGPADPPSRRLGGTVPRPVRARAREGLAVSPSRGAAPAGSAGDQGHADAARTVGAPVGAERCLSGLPDVNARPPTRCRIERDRLMRTGSGGRARITRSDAR